MKKYFKYAMMFVATFVMSASLVSCESNNKETDDDGIDENVKTIIKTYVDDVVVSTYKSLADASMELLDACQSIQENKDQAHVQAACDKWIEARKYWELSEAFLYGAAADYNIDPSIDSWPLMKSQLDILLENIKNPNYVLDVANLGYGLKGFHAIEYVIFRDGKARDVAEITADELTLGVAVAENLSAQCIRLEASWAGLDNVTKAKQDILAEAELEPTNDYGEELENAGLPGNTKYKSQMAAFEEILTGATDIADEVGNSKISDPCNSGNVLDVESWYSWNSITDFTDNMRSVRNAYYGTLDGSISKNSVSAYIAGKNSALDTKLKSAIDLAIKEVAAMPTPFRQHLTFEENQAAIDACNALKDALDEAIELVNE